MELNEILKELEEFLVWVKESLDQEAPLWGRAKALVAHNDDVKKVKLASLKCSFTGSDASKETQALAHPAYIEFLEKRNQDMAEFYTLDYKKSIKQDVIDVLRSLLSFNKNRITQDI